MQSVIVLKGFIKQIKLLMVTMEQTFSEWNFSHSYIRQLTYLNLFWAESYLKFEPEEISVEFIHVIGAMAYLA